MSTKAGKEKREYTTSAGSVQERESAPSDMRPDEDRFARYVGLIGLAALLIGLDLVCWMIWDRSLTRLLLFWLTKQTGIDTWKTIFGSACFVGGLGGLLFHATCEKEMQLRRTYGIFGLLWLVVGLVFMLLPLFNLMTKDGLPWAAHFFVPGFLAQCLGLAFMLAFVRNETDVDWKRLSILILGGMGAAVAVVGFVVSTIRPDFLVWPGFLLTGMGLLFLWGFIFNWGERDDIAELVARGTAIAGGAFFLIALVRSILPGLLRWQGYFIPTGLFLMGLGFLYVSLYVLFRVDWRFVAMVRRELVAFFYSPIAYLVLFGFTLVAWGAYIYFLIQVLNAQERQSAMFEPIVLPYFLGWLPIVATLFIVPALTMRLLSEEQRSGTLEVLLTAPVSEVQIVLSKYLATLIFFMLLWLPWCLFLIPIRYGADRDFDIRPLLSFLIALLCSGGGFLAMGMFFSAVTRNQVIAAVLAFAGVFGMLFVYFGSIFISTGPIHSVLQHMSFVELWLNSLEGKLQLQLLIFHISATIFWLFLTVKVLEARKWS